MNFESLTLGNISSGIVFLVGFIGAVAALLRYSRKGLTKVVKDEIAPLKDKIDSISREIERTQVEAARDYISHFLSRVDAGAIPTDSELECYYENLDIYESRGGNGFIHSWIARLEKEGKLQKRKTN